MSQKYSINKKKSNLKIKMKSTDRFTALFDIPHLFLFLSLMNT